MSVENKYYPALTEQERSDMEREATEEVRT